MSTMIAMPSRCLAANTFGLLIEPESVHPARRYAAQYIAARTGLPTKTPGGDGHIENVTWVVSELVTNAIRYGAGDDDRTPKNITLEIEVWTKWTRIRVGDRDPKVYDLSGDDERGRGLTIVEALAERWWWQHGEISKFANAIVLRPGVKLTGRDRRKLDEMSGQ